MKKLILSSLFLMVGVFCFGQNLCAESQEDPPGCLFKCETYEGNIGGFITDSIALNSSCNNSLSSQWFRVIAEDDFLKITSVDFGCPSVRSYQISIFDKNLHEIAVCMPFRSNTNGQFVLVENLSPGELYSILINSSEPLFCDFKIHIEGHEALRLGVTPDIQVESGSGLKVGELYIADVQDAQTYFWEIPDSTGTEITARQGTNRISYSNPSGEFVDEICVTPKNICEEGVRKCISLQYEECPTNSLILPGCNWECPYVSIPANTLSADGFKDIIMGCDSFQPKITYWIAVEARDTFLKVVNQRHWLASDVLLQIFDSNLNPVSNCDTFGTHTKGAFILASNVIPGKVYSICIGAENPNSSIELAVYGHKSYYDPLPQIQLMPGSNRYNGKAYINRSALTGDIVWTFVRGEIISGQRTDTIEYSNLGLGNDICIDRRTNECADWQRECISLPKAYSSYYSDPCLPVVGGIPAGNDAPGCFVCGPVYSGSTELYGPSAPGSGGFPCGTIENNQFVSIIADSTGTISATIIASNCINNQGAQAIFYDESFNVVSPCFSSDNDLPANVTASGLIPGEVYWLMIDGYAGDICDIFIILNKAYFINNPEPLGAIKAEPAQSQYCIGSEVCFSVDPVKDAEYEWLIPANAKITKGGSPREIGVCVEFTDVGSGFVQVVTKNPCFLGDTAVLQTEAVSVISITQPPEFICENDFPVVKNGNIFNAPGIYDITYTGASGCDSIVQYNLASLSQNENNIDTVICLGSCFQIGNICYDQPGTYRITLEPPYQQLNGCDSIVNLTLTLNSQSVPSSNFTTTSPVCANEPITVIYTGNASASANFNWNFENATILSGTGAGPYEISYSTAGGHPISLEVEENGCNSPITEQTIVVNDRLPSFSVNCSSTVSEIVFSWSAVQGATNYRVNSLSGQSGNLNGTSYTILGLSPNEEVSIEVIAENNAGCAASSVTKTCTAQDCPAVSVSIAPVADICLNQFSNSVQLSASQNGGTGIGDFFWSGPGISPSGEFDPTIVGAGNHQIEVRYSEGGCEYISTQTIQVLNAPTADFSAPSLICETETFMVSYTGNASGGATYNWDFGGAQVVSGAGQGPYELKIWDSRYINISLQVEESGCISNTNTKLIQIDEILRNLNLNCGASTTSSITFVWDSVSNASGYLAETLFGQQGIQSGNSYEVPVSFPGQTVTVAVTAISSNSCGNIVDSIICASAPCLPLSIMIEPLNTAICEGDSMQIQLRATLSDATGGGIFRWSGAGVSPDGVWNTSGLITGDYSIEVEYLRDNGCVYNQSQTFTINPAIEVTETILSPIWFPGNSGGIDVSASGGVEPYDFEWSDGRFTPSLQNVAPGDYCITVTDQRSCETIECYTIGTGIFRTSPLVLMCEGEPKQLLVRPGRGADFSWPPAAGLSCSDCASPIANPSKSTIYSVTANLFDGRSDSTSVVVIVLPQLFCNLAANLSEEEVSAILTNTNFEKPVQGQLLEVEQKIIEFFAEKQLKIVPNPTAGQVDILTPEKIEKTEVFDFSGRKVLETFDAKIDLSPFAEGVYFFKIKTEGKTVVRKVVLI